MKLGISVKTHAFTLAEMLIAVAIASTILAVTLTSSVALQRSFSEVDNYSMTHMQQIRIVDYLARDVRRGLSVISSVDRQMVTITIPKYIYQAGDADLPDASKIGTPRPPKREYDPQYSTGDAKITYGNTGTSTVIYRVQGSSILRTQDGVVTTIASSTDKLIPETIDTEPMPTRIMIVVQPRTTPPKNFE